MMYAENQEYTMGKALKEAVRASISASIHPTNIIGRMFGYGGFAHTLARRRIGEPTYEQGGIRNVFKSDSVVKERGGSRSKDRTTQRQAENAVRTGRGEVMSLNTLGRIESNTNETASYVQKLAEEFAAAKKASEVGSAAAMEEMTAEAARVYGSGTAVTGKLEPTPETADKKNNMMGYVSLALLGGAGLMVALKYLEKNFNLDAIMTKIGKITVNAFADLGKIIVEDIPEVLWNAMTGVAGGISDAMRSAMESSKDKGGLHNATKAGGGYVSAAGVATAATPPAKPGATKPAAVPAGSTVKPVAPVRAGAAPNLTVAPGVNTEQVNPALIANVNALQKKFGKRLQIISGHRDMDHNKDVGGAKGSQHLHGNAVDIKFSGTKEETNQLIEMASAMGFGGIGVYDPGNVHLDMGPRRAWGPGGKSSSIPSWAQASLAKHTGQARAPRGTDNYSAQMRAAAVAAVPAALDVASTTGVARSQALQAATVASDTQYQINEASLAATAANRSGAGVPNIGMGRTRGGGEGTAAPGMTQPGEAVDDIVAKILIAMGVVTAT
jgi:hypothetical protein